MLDMMSEGMMLDGKVVGTIVLDVVSTAIPAAGAVVMLIYEFWSQSLPAWVL